MMDRQIKKVSSELSGRKEGMPQQSKGSEQQGDGGGVVGQPSRKASGTRDEADFRITD